MAATRKAVATLRDGDPVMARLIDEHGTLVRRELKQENDEPRGDAYGALLRSIVGQQLSTKAAATIYGRMLELFGGHAPTPRQLLEVDPDLIRAAGLSRPKISYLRDLALHVEEGRVDLEQLPELSDEEVIAQLTDIKGLGQWTADMFLMFHLRRPGHPARRRPGNPPRGPGRVPPAQAAGREAAREGRAPVAALQDAGVPVSVELAGQQAAALGSRRRGRY